MLFSFVSKNCIFFRIQFAPLIKPSSVLMFIDIMYPNPTPAFKTLSRPCFSKYFGNVPMHNLVFCLTCSDGLPVTKSRAWISSFSETIVA